MVGWCRHCSTSSRGKIPSTSARTVIVPSASSKGFLVDDAKKDGAKIDETVAALGMGNAILKKSNDKEYVPSLVCTEPSMKESLPLLPKHAVRVAKL